MGVAALVIALFGIVLLYNISAVLGFLVYLVAFIISLHMLRSKVSYDESFSIIKFLKNISLKNFFDESVHTIIVACLPIVVIIGWYQWVVVDTFRFINSLY